MYCESIYVLCEMVHKPTRTDVCIHLASRDRSEIEELILSLWEEYSYNRFLLYLLRGEYDPIDAKEYADKVAASFADNLSIVEVPLWI